MRISCKYLFFTQTEDIWLKSALEGKRGILLITKKEGVNRRFVSSSYLSSIGGIILFFYLRRR
jgi:hypothetical protein